MAGVQAPTPCRADRPRPPRLDSSDSKAFAHDHVDRSCTPHTKARRHVRSRCHARAASRQNAGTGLKRRWSHRRGKSRRFGRNCYLGARLLRQTRRPVCPEEGANRIDRSILRAAKLVGRPRKSGLERFAQGLGVAAPRSDARARAMRASIVVRFLDGPADQGRPPKRGADRRQQTFARPPAARAAPVSRISEIRGAHRFLQQNARPSSSERP